MKRDWLIDLRVAAGKKQKDIAASAEISQPAYCAIEAGTKTPAVATAKKIATVLGFDWTRFFEEPEAVEDTA